MLIKEWMSKPVITIRSNESLTDAARMFQSRVISMLPVLKNGRLAGVITDGDVVAPRIGLCEKRCFEAACGIQTHGLYGDRIEYRQQDGKLSKGNCGG